MYIVHMFAYDRMHTLAENLAGIRFFSPRSLGKYLGRCGCKLRFETRYRWAIYYKTELVGFLKISH